jgi:hypothetical protein
VFKPTGIAIFVTFLLSTTAVAQTTSPEAKSASPSHDEGGPNMLPPAVGDHWTYEIRDNISGDLKGDSTQTITDLKGDEISIQTHALGAPNSIYMVYDHLWDMKSNPVWKFSPNDGGGVKDSMKEGQTWDFKTTDVKDARAMWKRTGTSKVRGEESVTTQAGTFTAIKYETTVHVRGAVDPTKKADMVVTTWYVPSVDHWVKRTEKTMSDGHVRNSMTVELVDFGRQ